MSSLRQLIPPLLGAALVALPVDSSADVATGDLGTEYPVGEIVERITTAHDAAQEYALYLPSAYGSVDRSWPVLFVLDPRGRAIPGIERFLPAAERRGYVVLSSYQSRSDTLREVNYKALNALLTDSQRRFSIDLHRLYLAGMSGTAHAVWRFGQILGDNVAGVIAAAGGVQTRVTGPPGEARFVYYGITATADFNYQEVMELERHLLEREIDHRIAIFDGRHGWPPHELTNRALDWMELQAVKRGLAASDSALIDGELQRARAAADEADDPLEELRRYRDIVRDFGGLREVASDVDAVRRLETDPEVPKRRALEKKLARAEGVYLNARYGPWVTAMRNPDRRPPTVRKSLVALQIQSLQKRAANRDKLAEARSALRSLESLHSGVAFYLARDFEKAGDLDRAIRCLEVATAIFPEWARDYWSLAGANVRAGRPGAALEALRKATALGNVDLERLKTDPTWEPLRDRPEWSELVASAARRLADD